MKLLIDIADDKAAGFIEMIKSYATVKATPISTPDVETLDEIKKIKKAFKDTERLKSGKLKARPIEDLLNEL
jgi:hypothetical protein